MGLANRHHAKAGRTNIIPIDDSAIDVEIPRSLLIPHKWAAELVDKHCLPAEFLNFIVDKLKGWTKVEQENNKFLITWALAACGATNKTSSKNVSQLGTPLADFDLISDKFDNWTKARLFQTLEGRANASFRGGNGGHSGGAMQPIFHVNIPDVPRPTIDQMELAFHGGQMRTSMRRRKLS